MSRRASPAPACLATGNAAGHGSTLVGEGIRFAIYSGQMAGEVAAEAVRAGDASAEFLARYERQWRARFGREMELSYLIDQRIAAWSDAKWDAGVEMLARLSPAQAAELLRGDYSAGLFLGVLRRNPGLLRTGARKFFDLALSRLGRPSPVTEADLAPAGQAGGVRPAPGGYGRDGRLRRLGCIGVRPQSAGLTLAWWRGYTERRGETTGIYAPRRVHRPFTAARAISRVAERDQ